MKHVLDRRGLIVLGVGFLLGVAGITLLLPRPRKETPAPSFRVALIQSQVREQARRESANEDPSLQGNITVERERLRDSVLKGGTAAEEALYRTALSDRDLAVSDLAVALIAEMPGDAATACLLDCLDRDWPGDKSDQLISRHAVLTALACRARAHELGGLSDRVRSRMLSILVRGDRWRCLALDVLDELPSEKNVRVLSDLMHEGVLTPGSPVLAAAQRKRIAKSLERVTATQALMPTRTPPK